MRLLADDQSICSPAEGCFGLVAAEADESARGLRSERLEEAIAMLLACLIDLVRSPGVLRVIIKRNSRPQS
jgi:hypothetical protein